MTLGTGRQTASNGATKFKSSCSPIFLSKDVLDKRVFRKTVQKQTSPPPSAHGHQTAGPVNQINSTSCPKHLLRARQALCYVLEGQREESALGGCYTLPRAGLASGGPRACSPTLLLNGHLPPGLLSHDAFPHFRPPGEMRRQPHCAFALHDWALCYHACSCTVGLRHMELLLSPGVLQEEKTFNEALLVKGILNKQMPHLAASPADLPEIHTIILHCPSDKLQSLSPKLTLGKRTTQDNSSKGRAERVCHRCPQAAWLRGWPWAGAKPAVHIPVTVPSQWTSVGSSCNSPFRWPQSVSAASHHFLLQGEPTAADILC